jgi:FMN reductase [NAD(P)H]
MNETINIIKDHRSIRDFKSKVIADDILEEIIVAAQSMPNSINGQQTSIIIIKDQDKRNKIAEYAGGQPWIKQAPVFLLFIVDFYKTNVASKKNDLEQVIHESVEGTIVGSVDIGLNMGAAIIAAESLGLGIVPIGGIRNAPQEMIELFDLPDQTFPIAGLSIGYPNSKPKKKPRLPLNTFAHNETYHSNKIIEEIDAYDSLMEQYYKEIDRENSGNWSKRTSKIYRSVYFPKVHPVMKKQGFKNNK